MDGWDIAVQRFDEVQKGLLESIISKKLLENERYGTFVINCNMSKSVNEDHPGEKETMLFL